MTHTSALHTLDSVLWVSLFLANKAELRWDQELCLVCGRFTAMSLYKDAGRLAPLGDTGIKGLCLGCGVRPVVFSELKSDSQECSLASTHRLCAG